MDRKRHKSLPVNSFNWVENTFQFNKDFIENYNEDSDIGYLLETDVKYPGKLHDFNKDFPFLSKNIKIEKISQLA